MEDLQTALAEIVFGSLKNNREKLNSWRILNKYSEEKENRGGCDFLFFYFLNIREIDFCVSVIQKYTLLN